MRTRHMRIVPHIATKASIGVLTLFEPYYDLLYFLFGQLMV